MKNQDLGSELDPDQLLLQVSMFEKRLLHDIMKAARGAAVSRRAASNHSQMFCSPRRARTGPLAGSTAAPAVSPRCSGLLRVLRAAVVGKSGAAVITQTLHLSANVKPKRRLR